MCGANAIRGHRLVCFRNNLQKCPLIGHNERPGGRDLGTCLSVFNSDGSKDVIRITDAVQGWNVALICAIFTWGTVRKCVSANLIGEKRISKEVDY